MEQTRTKYCPLCEERGLEKQELKKEEITIGQERWVCTNKHCEASFCIHVLNATPRDINSFSCQGCSSPIDNCDCYDCNIFCEECNSFIFIDCSDLYMIMQRNKERTLEITFEKGLTSIPPAISFKDKIKSWAQLKIIKEEERSLIVKGPTKVVEIMIHDIQMFAKRQNAEVEGSWSKINIKKKDD